jgi:hypothetical protein
MMRVYLPMTLPALSVAHASGTIAAAGRPLCAHAVTPAVREWYIDGDQEELEYAALTEAAQTSLRLLAADPAAPRRRVVVAADVPDAAVHQAVGAGTGARSAVTVDGQVEVAWVASVHLDETEAEATVSAAVSALPAADAGDDDAQFMLGEVEGCDLLWYDVTEIPDLIQGSDPVS